MPATLTLYSIVTSKASTKAAGVKCDSFLLDLSLDGMRNYVREDEWNRFCNQCYLRVRRDPKIQKELIQQFIKRVPKFLGFCKKVHEELKNG